MYVCWRVRNRGFKRETNSTRTKLRADASTSIFHELLFGFGVFHIELSDRRLVAALTMIKSATTFVNCDIVTFSVTYVRQWRIA